MLCLIFGVIIGATIYALIGGIALKLAYKLVFTKYSMEYLDAFKLMFIAGLFAYGASIVMIVTGVDEGPAGYVLPTLVNFIVVTFVLMNWEGLNLGQSAAVGAITSVFFVLIQIALVMLLFGAAVGAGAAASP